ncbi:hypothetical protein RND71_005737 [Anisodus tanguticus]|uniref:Uncharacterized protein n=1 Tax=Anisodus tanguticus TaxID=243964 RepID=A0AAE1SS30_9SOLA|nr:hypothetical protein RND71_005737 [Anisodus tanguticus]
MDLNAIIVLHVLRHSPSLCFMFFVFIRSRSDFFNALRTSAADGGNRHLSLTSNTKLMVDLFNPPKDVVSLESEPAILIDQFKVELARVTTITRKSSSADDVDDVVGDCAGVSSGVIVDGASVGDGDTVGDVVGDGVGGVDNVVACTTGEKFRDDDDVHSRFGSGVGGYTLLSDRFSSVGAGISKMPSCVCQYKTCNNKINELIKKVNELIEA